MSTTQHFKKRKSRTSSVSASTTANSSSIPTTRRVSGTVTPSLPPLFAAGVPVDPPLSKSDTVGPSESATLAAALTALRVTLTRDLESFTPPTPAVSPAHRTTAKRARFDFDSGIDDCESVAVDLATKASPAAPTKARGALLAVSTRIQFELEKRLRRNSERSQRKRKQQLSYVAIIGAFHQAQRERERSAASNDATSVVTQSSLVRGLGHDCSVAVAAADDRRW